MANQYVLASPALDDHWFLRWLGALLGGLVRGYGHWVGGGGIGHWLGIAGEARTYWLDTLGIITKC